MLKSQVYREIQQVKDECSDLTKGVHYLPSALAPSPPTSPPTQRSCSSQLSAVSFPEGAAGGARVTVGPRRQSRSCASLHSAPGRCACGPRKDEELADGSSAPSAMARRNSSRLGPLQMHTSEGLGRNGSQSAESSASEFGGCWQASDQWEERCPSLATTALPPGDTSPSSSSSSSRSSPPSLSITNQHSADETSGWTRELTTASPCSSSASSSAHCSARCCARLPISPDPNPGPHWPREGLRFMRWSLAEEHALVLGVNRFGPGYWSQIRDTFACALSRRSNMQLKDKWVNLRYMNHVQRVATPAGAMPQFRLHKQPRLSIAAACKPGAAP
eukprot:GHVT01024821.1.p1 GENE.GHVT01024821.1~~GHVT01024821.1.p1  ORF type:complete len:378 (-),score=91.78 GHVT01024821.1:404-1399(-)